MSGRGGYGLSDRAPLDGRTRRVEDRVSKLSRRGFDVGDVTSLGAGTITLDDNFIASAILLSGRPYVCTDIMLNASVPVSGNLRAGIYRSAPDDIEDGSITARRAALCQAVPLAVAPAIYCLELDRAVELDPDAGLWFVGVWGDTVGTLVSGDGIADGLRPASFQVTTPGSLPDLWQYGGTGTAVRAADVLGARALTLTGRRILCD